MTIYEQQAVYLLRRVVDNMGSHIGSKEFGNEEHAIKAIATELEIFYTQGALDQLKICIAGDL